jgi:hypothetical protein
MGKLTSQSFAQLYFQVERVKAVVAKKDPALRRQTLYIGGATLSHQPIQALFV